MTPGLTIILVVAAVMAGVAVLAVVSWFIYTAVLNRREARLAVRKGLYRDLVTGLASRERALLEPALRQFETLSDVEALEAVLEEQARGSTERPGWLLDTYDRLGLVDKYIDRLRNARRWRDRAFAAELLGRVGNARAVPVLLETVRSTRTEDADVREIALRALARIADPRAVPPLAQAFSAAPVWLAPRLADILSRHGDPAIEPMIAILRRPESSPSRAWAASVLGELRAERAFPLLVDALGDPDEEVRGKSATALGRLGDPRAVPHLLQDLLADPAPFVRTRIANALGQFHDPAVIDRLVRALGDSAWWVRMRSVEALEQIGDAAEGPLLLALDDPDPEIRFRSAAALERLRVPSRLVTLIAEGERPEQATATLAKFAAAGARELLADELHHPVPAVRLAVIGAISSAGRADFSGELLDAVGDKEPAVRAAALETLSRLDIREAVPAAVDCLGDADQQVRLAALELVGRLGSPSALVPAIRPRATDPSPVVRAAAAQALGALGGEAIQPLLRDLLADSEPEVREAAVRAAMRARRPALAPAVRPLLDDPSPEVRRAAAEALGRIGAESDAAALLAAMANATPEFREAAADSALRLAPARLPELLDRIERAGDASGKLGLVRAIPQAQFDSAEPILERLSQDPSPEVRAVTLSALAQIGSSHAADHARRGLDDPDAGVRASAADTLVRLDTRSAEPALRARLVADPSPAVRERAALAAGLFPTPEGAQALLEVCGREEPAEVHAAAVLALGAFPDHSPVAELARLPDESAVRTVLQARLHSDSEYRLLARRLQATRRTELRALVSHSRDAMESAVAEGSRTALDLGERLRLVSALRAFQGDRSRTALLHVLRSDPSPEVRAAALRAVAEMVSDDDRAQAVQRALGDPSPTVRRAAVAAAAGLAPEAALDALLRGLRADERSDILAEAAKQVEANPAALQTAAESAQPDSAEAAALMRLARYLHHPLLAPTATRLARSETPEVREAVADLWAARTDLADPESVAALTQDPVVVVRRAAVRAAVATGRSDAVRTAAEDPDAGVRRALALALQGAPELPFPVALETDPSEPVRAAAAVSRLLRSEAADLPPGVTRPAAAQAVRDLARLDDLRAVARTAPDPRHRLGAALALALVGDPVAREVADSDPIPALRRQVAETLPANGNTE